ncbi:MAG: SRPBCC family protein, partial [Acidimicrobiales bacterium]
MKRKCSAEVVVQVTPEEVWALVADVTRVGEWSGECRGCSWVEGSQRAAPGARFRGRNRRGGFRWTRLNEIVRADGPRELVWRTIPSGIYTDSVEWRIRIEPQDGSTRVGEAFEIVKLARPLEWFLWVAAPWHRDRSDDLVEDLLRLKAVVEQAPLQ